MSRARDLADLVGGSVPVLTRKYYDVVNVATSNKAEFTNIPSNARKIVIEFIDVGTDVGASAGTLAGLVSVGGTYITTGYDGLGHYSGYNSANGTEVRTTETSSIGDNIRVYYWDANDNRRTDGRLSIDLIDSSTYLYKMELIGSTVLNTDNTPTGITSGNIYSSAFIDLSGPIDKVKIELDGAGSIDHGSAIAYYEI
jgi:hypothetical protein